MNSKKMRNTYFITAILFVIAGIILVSWPETTMNIVCYGLGGLILIYGAFQIYTYYNGKKEETNYHMNLITGIIGCGIGLFMLIKSDIVISILPFIIGFTLLLESLLKFKHGYDLRKVGYEGFKWIMLIASITLLLAGLLVYNPFNSVISMVMFIGICLIYDGFSELWTLYCVTKYIKQQDSNDSVIDVVKEKDKEVENANATILEDTNTKFTNLMVDETLNNEKK